MIKSLEDRIIQLLLKQSRKVAYFCEAENISANNSIHEIRKSLKRIRAWMELYHDLPGALHFADEVQQFREQGKNLTLARESSVNLILFDKFFSNKHFLAEKKVREISDKLTEENHKQIENLISEKNSFSLLKKTSETFVENLQKKKLEISENKIINVISESFLKAYELYTNTEDIFDSENLHKLRIRLKTLWYQIEAAKQLQVKYFMAKARQLNDITETMGCDHDNYILLLNLQHCCYAGLSSSEQKVIENTINHQHELSVFAIAGKLKLFFSETPDEFRDRIASYARKANKIKISG